MARLAFALIVFLSFTNGEAASSSSNPNIVLIISDYMGYSDIEPHGATDVSTPALARLANDGVTMTEFYAAAPVCGPARAALYSGQYPARVGFEKNIRTDEDGLSSSNQTLSRWLKNAGYKTALFGKWHLGNAPDFTPAAHGYDEFVGHHTWTISYFNHKDANGEPGLYVGQDIVHREGEYLTDLLTNQTVEFIARNSQQPFFVTLAYNAALPPYQPPDLPESRWDEGWDVNSASRDDYIKMVERMDMGIGKVLDALDEYDIAKNTLVIYTYDHGGRHLVNSAPYFHGFSNLWEGGIRTPAILRMPGVIPGGERSAVPGIAMDLTATIVDAAGVAGVSDLLDGVNLIPILNGETPPPDRAFFWRSDLYEFGKQRAIRQDNWKYVVHDNTQFLFDLSEDPGERENLFYKEPDTVRRLRSDLDQWLHQFPD